MKLTIANKDYTISFSFSALCKLEELGCDLFNGGLDKLTPKVLRNVILAGISDNHSDDEGAALIKALRPKDIKEVSEKLLGELKESLGE